MTPQVGFITKAGITFNALLTFYILNSQDRRFAQVDADAKAALSQASDAMRGKAGEALGFTKMFGNAFGFGGSAPPAPTKRASSPPSDNFGGFDSSATSPDSSSQQPAWPGSGNSGGA